MASGRMRCVLRGSLVALALFASPAYARPPVLIGVWRGTMQCPRGARPVRLHWQSVEDSDIDLKVVILPPASWEPRENYRAFLLDQRSASGFRIILGFRNVLVGAGSEVVGKLIGSGSFEGRVRDFEGCTTLRLERRPDEEIRVVKSA